ncbi:MAG: SusC/RagA family TonB-linked outer membrane protein [Saprospiraceae bacterium]|nr:SusC/RagA family TonB-linked outer membrane protein [Candidatus Defluviibacterium haderslevense]
MKKVLLMLLAFFSVMLSTEAQRLIKGNVTDKSGDPVIGANVLAKGTTVGTITDINGNYTLSVPEGVNSIIVSYTGYTSQELVLGASNMMDIKLEEGVLLQETVITALGISKSQKSLGYGIQEVSGSEITNANTTSALEALSGKVAGLQTIKSNGSAGAPTRVILRGPSTFNGNNEALIVVDGIRISNAENHSERSLGGVSNSNRGMDINPNDIASVSVLKGGAASALYGAEGANGVILITTKKGRNTDGKINVDFNTSMSFSSYNKLPKLQNNYVQGSGGKYNSPATGQSGSWGAKADTLFWDGVPNAFDKRGNIVGKSNPNAKDKFVPYDSYDVFQTGATYNNNINFTGGSKIFNFKVSAGHLSEQGITPLNTFARTNLGTAIGSDLIDNKLHIGAQANFSNSGGRRIQQGSNTSGLMLGLFRTPISFDNSYGYGNSAVDERDAIYQPNGKQRNYRGGGGYDNPYWVIVNNPFRDNVNRLIGGMNVSYDFHKWFTLGTNVGLDNYSDNRVQSFEINSRAFPSGRIFDDTYLYRSIDWYINASGNGSLSDNFTLDYNIGTNIYKTNLNNNYIQGDGFSFPGFPNLANASAITTTKTLKNTRTLSFLGSASLGYKNFLYLNLTGRQDYLSSLIDPAKELKVNDIAIFYPSASLGFVFSELMHLDAVDFGKVRIAYSAVGAGAPDAYLTSTSFVVPPTAGTVNDLNDGWTNGIGFPFNGGVTGFEKDNVLGAQGLVPSLSKEIELGLEMKFLKNRIGFDLSVYKKNAIDQIVTVPIAASTGYQRATINSGELETKGIDLALGINPVRMKNLNWDINFNFTKWKTLVLSIADGVDQIYLDGFQGSSVYNLAPKKDANGKVTKTYEYGQLYGGVWLRDGNGNLVIDDDPNSDYYVKPIADPIQGHLGNPNPDFLLGINNSFTFKNLNLSFLFDIKSGGQMWNGTKGALTFFGRSENTDNRGSEKVFEGVNGHLDADGNPVIGTTKNTIKTVLDQAWYQDNGGGFGVVAEDFIEDASFIRLRNISLSYKIGDHFKSNKILKGVTVTLSGQNLWLKTPYTGIDPETSLVGSNSNGQGLDYFGGPNTKSVTAAVALKF